MKQTNTRTPKPQAKKSPSHLGKAVQGDKSPKHQTQISKRTAQQNSKKQPSQNRPKETNLSHPAAKIEPTSSKYELIFSTTIDNSKFGVNFKQSTNHYTFEANSEFFAGAKITRLSQLGTVRLYQHFIEFFRLIFKSKKDVGVMAEDPKSAAEHLASQHPFAWMEIVKLEQAISIIVAIREKVGGVKIACALMLDENLEKLDKTVSSPSINRVRIGTFNHRSVHMVFQEGGKIVGLWLAGRHICDLEAQSIEQIESGVFVEILGYVCSAIFGHIPQVNDIHRADGKPPSKGKYIVTFAESLSLLMFLVKVLKNKYSFGSDVGTEQGKTPIDASVFLAEETETPEEEVEFEEEFSEDDLADMFDDIIQDYEAEYEEYLASIIEDPDGCFDDPVTGEEAPENELESGYDNVIGLDAARGFAEPEAEVSEYETEISVENNTIAEDDSLEKEDVEPEEKIEAEDAVEIEAKEPETKEDPDLDNIIFITPDSPREPNTPENTSPDQQENKSETHTNQHNSNTAPQSDGQSSQENEKINKSHLLGIKPTEDPFQVITGSGDLSSTNLHEGGQLHMGSVTHLVQDTLSESKDSRISNISGEKRGPGPHNFSNLIRPQEGGNSSKGMA